MGKRLAMWTRYYIGEDKEGEEEQGWVGWQTYNSVASVVEQLNINRKTEEGLLIGGVNSYST